MKGESLPARRGKRRGLDRDRARLRPLLVAATVLALLVPTTALAAFPDNDPNPRVGTPNDPDYDDCEPDDEDGTQVCSNPFDQSYQRFGFAPNNTEATALYDPLALPARQSAQNTAAGRNPLGQVSGYSADVAWKLFDRPNNPEGLVGDPEVEIAILDTGIRWNNGDLRTEIALNEDELPRPLNGGSTCGADDCDGDGRFNVEDFANDGRVASTAGHDSADGLLDASDLIAVFSDGDDTDGNGYVDDIAGWDFFDDDNDPYDASSYSQARGHGTGRAEEAGARGNNGNDSLGVCPDCQIVPVRVWDTFVVDAVNFAQGMLYAADNGIEVVEGAVGGLSNTEYAESVFAYAYSKGTLPVLVSSDLNTANHNYPTNYDQALHVQGSVADAHGLGENCPQECIDFFAALPDPVIVPSAGPPGNAPIGTWFRNAGLTQYGGHAHIVMMGTTGSENTGQAAGAAGLVYSYARLRGIDIEPNEVKQLLTLTAEDVHPLNTLGTGTPDPAQVGWDQHFGYGRVDLGLALERIANQADSGASTERMPPQALITAPDWFAPLNLATQDEVEISADLSAPRSALATGYDWELRWAPGIEPCEADFAGAGRLIAAGSDETGELSGPLGRLDLQAVRDALDARVLSTSCGNPPAPVTGGSTPDATAPSKGPGDVDPNEPAFTVRVQVSDEEGNVGEDRKVLFAYEDSTLEEGWSRPVGGEQDVSGEAHGGGESSHRMFDVDGDNDLEVVEATSSGELWVLDHDGTPNPSFNDGKPARTREYANAHPGSPGYGQGLEPPRESLRVPAIGDIDGDREAEIVDSAGEHVFAWELDGAEVDGFPVRIDPANSRVADRSERNHVKRGFIASPALGDLDGDGALEVVIAGLDQHLYAWDGEGQALPGFPVYLRERDAGGSPVPCASGKECAESINTPAIGDITGDGEPEIVVPTAEVAGSGASLPPTSPDEFAELFEALLNGTALGTGNVYAVDSSGAFLPGWPIENSGLIPDILPLVGPGVDHVLGNVDGDQELELIGNLATGDAYAKNGDGGDAVPGGYQSTPTTGDHADKSKILNLFENPIVADLDGLPGLEVMKGGLTTGQAVNLLAVGQNVPYNHVLQAWSGATGEPLPAFPQAVEDYQLLSSPAVGDVGDLPGKEVIVGTGLYLIRSFGADGVEAPGWPKFTGGWNFAVPAIGDVDGDGELEVAAQTREGFAFLWETGGPACDGGNDEWWTSRHDEWNTGAYPTDSRPPGSPADLIATRNDDGSHALNWTAPGEDWLCGDAESYELRVANDPIDSPGDGRSVATADAGASGEDEVTTLAASDASDARYAAVLYEDDAGNWGRLASVELEPEPAGPGDPPDPGDPGDPAHPADPADAPDPGGPDGPGPPAGDCETEIAGTQGPDRLRGRGLGERIHGRGGDDEIHGRSGNDCLFGNAGSDELRGQRGADTLNGGSGADLLVGNRGADEIHGGGGADRIKGGGGTEQIHGGGGRDRISAGASADVIDVRGGGRDRVRCGGGRDRVEAGRRDEVKGDCERVVRGR